MTGQSYCLIWCDRARYVAQGTPAEITTRIGQGQPFAGCLGMDGDEYMLATDKISSIIPITLDEARAIRPRSAHG